MKKILSLFLSTCILISFITCTVRAESYDEVKKISTKDFYNQAENDYYVYFYYENCPFCNSVKSNMLKFADTFKNVYFVDYKKSENRRKSYDWESLMKKYNKIVGHVNAQGEIIYKEGESKEKYKGLRNDFGKEMSFSFEVVDEYNIEEFPESNIGDVVANVQTPEIDYYNIYAEEELIIAGVPSLLHIENGRIVNFYFDSNEISDFLESEGI